MYETIFFIFELLGTISFAASGALMALKKRMDVLGVCILGCVTAIGGGIIRDVILGIAPPKTFEHPVYVIVAIITSLVCCLPVFLKALSRNSLLETSLLHLMDAIGLGIFTVVGIQTAQEISSSNSIFLLLFVGVVTGVGGGVIRDIMANEKPYIFYKHFYATASIIGAFVCILLWGHINITLNICISAALIVVLRILAAKFRWKLPTPTA